MKPLAYLLAAAGLLAACKPASETKTVAASLVAQPAPVVATAAKEREISGTMFVVTRGGSAVKLAAVEIQVVEWKAASDHLEEARSVSAELSAKSHAELMVTIAQWSNSVTAWQKALASLENAQRNTAQLDYFVRQAACAPFFDRLLASRDASTILERKVESETTVQRCFSAWALSGEKAFDQPWPGVLQAVTTDADGAFKVRVPNNRQVVLVAKAKRSVGREEEEFFWCVTVAKSDIGPVHLSTANLLK